MIGLYVPGGSPLHRCPAGPKLAVLVAVLLVVGVHRTPGFVGLAAAFAVGAAVATRISPALVWRQVRPVLVIVVPAAALQWWWDGWQEALLAACWIVTSVLLAALVTLTTPMGALLDTLVRVLRPLRRVGIDPERVALVLTLAVRSVPVLHELAHQVHDARRARGAGGSPRAFAVPFVVRTVRHAHRLGEALVARGVDD
ncbi:MAG: energy-coupling factor transporter transmembrane protein EcfT [Kineosporiaceae bacterium]